MSPDRDPQLDRAAEAFHHRFNRRPVFAAAAPGRVNLIGEHTDYNEGFVLPMALERRTLVLAAARNDRQGRLISSERPGEVFFEISREISPGRPAWGNYVRGVVAGCLEAGLEVHGFDGWVDSTVPLGGGLSSSAALAVAAATLIESMTDQWLEPLQKAKLTRKAERDFAGMPCGIMDHFISAMGETDHALLIDCRSLKSRPVLLDDPGIAVLLVDSRVQHELAEGEYARRRAQCERAAAALAVSTLREATMNQLDRLRHPLEPTLFRRARHVIRENERTLMAADALNRRDWSVAGGLMTDSHLSLRDDFEVSCEELDLLVDLANAHEPVLGARMTGGGFGGCIVALVRADAVRTVGEAVARDYHERTGREARWFVSRPAAGAWGTSLERM